MANFIGNTNIQSFFMTGIKAGYINGRLLFNNELVEDNAAVYDAPEYDAITMSDYSVVIDSTEKDIILSWQIRDGKSGGSSRDNGNSIGDGGWSTDLNVLLGNSSSGGSVDSNGIPSRAWNGTEDISQYYANSVNGTNKIPQGFTDDASTTAFTLMLAKYWQTHQSDDAVAEAVKAGIDFITRNQVIFNEATCGGWGELYPIEDNTNYLYHNQITFNDSVHMNCMDVLYRVYNQLDPFEGDIVDSTTRTECLDAHALAEEAIYVLQNTNSSGVRSIWSGKYDKDTMLPINARGWEKKDNMTRESGRLIKYLLSISQSEKMKVCIHYGIEFFKRTQIEDTIYNQYSYPYLFTSSGDQVWPRFITRDTEVPIFYSASGVAYDEITDMDSSWVSSYWFTTEGESLITRDPVSEVVVPETEYTYDFQIALGSYFHTGVVPSQAVITEVYGWNRSTTGNQQMGARTSTVRYYWGKSGTGYTSLGWNAFQASSSLLDQNYHKHTIANGELEEDDTYLVGTSGETLGSVGSNDITIGALNNDGNIENFFDYKFHKCRIVDASGDEHWFKPDGVNHVIKHTINGVEQTDITIQGTVSDSLFAEYVA